MSQFINTRPRTSNQTKSILFTAVSAIGISALTCGASLAQVNAAAASSNTSETTVEQIVVTSTPIRDSIAASLAVQRNADNIVNAIASDTLGQFPDATAAGALARLPGIGVQRDQGQERYIQVRGAPTRWTTVALDGINVLGAEDRIFRFDSVPAVQISSVELNKTLLAEMPAEALAGNVNIRTFSPLDHDEGFSTYVDLGYGHGDLGDAPIQQYAARASWSNGVFGVSLSGSHYSFEQHTDNSEPRFRNGTIGQLRVTKYVIERQTESYSARLQYQPSADHRIELSHLKTEFNDFEERNQYRWEFQSNSRRYAWDTNPTGNNDYDTASFIGVPVVAAWEDGTYSNGVYHTRLSGEHRLGNWDTNWALAHTATEFVTWTPLVLQSTSNFRNAPTLDQDILNLPSIVVDVNAEARGIPTIQLHQTVSDGAGGYTFGDRITGLNAFNLNYSNLGEFSSSRETESWTYKADASREYTAFGADNTFTVGFQYDDRDQVSYSYSVDPAARGELSTVAAGFGMNWDPDNYAGGTVWDTNFPYGYSAYYTNNQQMFEFVSELDDAFTAANGRSIWMAGPQDEVAERVLGAYAQNRFDWGRHILTAGLRLERTEIDTTGLLLGQTFSLSSEDTQVFPSLYYKYDFRDDVVLRAAFVSGQARPSLTDMRASVSVNDTSDTVSGGNPNLTPETAYGIDLSAEWYFAPEALLSVNAYHREVRDTLFSSQTIINDDRYDTGGVDRTGYAFNSMLNGGDGELTGIEFTYYHPFTFLPGWLSGFGVQASAAFVDAEFQAIQADGTFQSAEFDGTSDQVYNAVLFYENYGLSARVTYQWRSDWADVPFASGSSANSGLYWDETQRVDSSIRYQVNDNLGLYMDATNVFDERGVRYRGQEDRPYEVEGFGRRVLFGVRANF